MANEAEEDQELHGWTTLRSGQENHMGYWYEWQKTANYLDA